jgi:hypothetical protein
MLILNTRTEISSIFLYLGTFSNYGAVLLIAPYTNLISLCSILKRAIIAVPISWQERIEEKTLEFPRMETLLIRRACACKTCCYPAQIGVSSFSTNLEHDFQYLGVRAIGENGGSGLYDRALWDELAGIVWSVARTTVTRKQSR